MKKTAIFTFLILSAFALAFKADHAKRHYFKLHLKNSPNETITGYTSTISGANDVEVVFDRTGPDAGIYAVSVDFFVTFDGQATYHSYTLDLGNQTHVVGHIQGPGVVGDAMMSDNITANYY
ncbi:hypothetical protein [Mucilaginibacter paludis]|uniref:Uncharacterized protein n=1 Tax=Mucilaginibacter paludis DSM 18603 TaxID=714943 RepID=H1Y393_9SPHI|nr:hypothetical protein [Mucilaginibacter paludis]EHQ29248.1 hypothetical protein Mucpa_5173 [Mucilaginibacter paludis DSM 18603]